MHFYRDIEDMPGYQEAGLAPEAVPPAGLVRLDNVALDFSSVYLNPGAKMEHLPQMRLTTIPAFAAFDAAIPVKSAGAVRTPCWVVLKLHVRRGRVGFCAFERHTGVVLASTAAIAPSAKTESVGLFVRDLSKATDIAVFSGGSASAEVDIFDAAVLVKATEHSQSAPR